jgi:hypothetical protein
MDLAQLHCIGNPSLISTMGRTVAPLTDRSSVKVSLYLQMETLAAYMVKKAKGGSHWFASCSMR